METWSLHHPTHGLIEVRAGYDSDLLAIHPDWPGTRTDDDVTRLTADSSLTTRAKSRLTNPPVRVEVLVDGVVQSRFETLESSRFPLFGKGDPHQLRTMVAIGLDRSKPNLNVQASPFKEILHIEFREGSQVVEFDPPAGSRGEKRRDTMQSSPLKRTAIPMLEGLGKAGWAILVLVLAPLVSRIVAKLVELLPDWELPEWSLPHLDLPVPALPQLELPTPTLPNLDISLPEMPDWVKLLAEYSKIWVPVVIGIAVGIIALRNYRKSERQKQQWRELEGRATEADTATEAEAADVAKDSN